MEALAAKYLILKPTRKTRKSAVLVILYLINNDIYFPLILRNSYEGLVTTPYYEVNDHRV